MFVSDGYEGIIIRNLEGGYKKKHRSKDLQKWKFFEDDEYEIVGKYCRIIMFDDWQIDLWLCNPANMAKGLSKRKLNSLVSALEVPVESTFSNKVTKSISFSVLEGEAWINLDLPDLILNNLKLLGIRKKRELTPIQKQSLVERLQGKAA